MSYSFDHEPAHIGELRRQIAKFVATRAPREARKQWDIDHRWPRDVFGELASLGICGLTIAEEYGGTGEDILAAVAVIEELSQAGAFLSGPFIHAAFYGGMNLSENGSVEQKALWLPKLSKGEAFFCYGLSEPNVGGDLASVETTAVMDGDHIILNGTKRWCTGADWSDVIYCLVRTGPADQRYKNLSFILVPTKLPAFR